MRAVAEALETIDRFSELLWNERDLDAAAELVHPDAVFDWSNSRAPYSGVYQGDAALRQFAESLWEAWEEWEPSVEEVIELDEDRVLTVTLVRARGMGSGVVVEGRGAVVWSMDDGRIRHAALFQSKAEALRAIALEGAGRPWL
jgi:ketosteroid isomerase-like protein